MMKEPRPTRNFLHPLMLIPAGTRMESPTGLPCRVVGRSQLVPGRIEVTFTTADGDFVQHIWPAELGQFRVTEAAQ